MISASSKAPQNLMFCPDLQWSCMLGVIAVVTLSVLTQEGVCEATEAPESATHTQLLMLIVCFFVWPVHTFVRVCVCVCVFPDLRYSLFIVKESVEQDPDPPAGSNQTHSSGLNGQLTIREAIVAPSPCASQLKGFCVCVYVSQWACVFVWLLVCERGHVLVCVCKVLFHSI